MARFRLALITGALVAAAVFASGPAAGTAPPAGVPALFYTSNHPPALKWVAYSTSGDVLRIGSIHQVAVLPAADGLGVAPDGQFLVGGGSTGKVFKVDPSSGQVESVDAYPGSRAAFHVTVSPDGAYALTAGLPGQLARVPLKPFATGEALPLKGDDPAVTTVGFTPVGTFYTASDSHGSGDFGVIDLDKLTTKRVMADLRGAHGIAYDPFTKDIFLVGSFAIVQIDPLAITSPGGDHPSVELSARTLGGTALDQAVADGHGHLLAASNTGEVWFLDYTATGLIGDAKAVKTSRVFLDTNLDDILLSNPPASGSVSVGRAGSRRLPVLPVAAGGVALAGAVIVLRLRRSRSSGRLGRGEAATF